MYMGLTMTSASTYQMLRGSVVIFTGLMSRVLLRRATAVHQVPSPTRSPTAATNPSPRVMPTPTRSPTRSPNLMLRRATAVHQVGVELRVGLGLVHPNVEPNPNPDATPNQWLGMTLVFTGALVVGSC